MKHPQPSFIRVLLATLVSGILFIGPASIARAQLIPPPREATPAQVTAGTAKNVYISPYNLRNSDSVVQDITIAGDDIFGVLGLNVTASATANKTLTLASSGSAGNIVFKSGSTTQGAFIGGGGLLMAGATGGNPALGVINAAGLKINGVDVSTSSDTYWTTTTGGITYASNVTTGGTAIMSGNASIAGNLTFNGTLTGSPTITGNLTVNGTGNQTFAGNIIAPDITLGTSGPSVKSSLAARAPAQGITLDGSGFCTPTNLTLPSKFTFSFRATPRDLNSPLGIAMASGSMAGLTWFATGTGTPRLYNGTKYIVSTETSTAGKTDVWTFVTDGTTATWYKNGVAAGSDTDGGAYGTTLTHWGYETLNPSGFRGTLGSPILFNRALSAAEVLALYERGAVDPSDIAASGQNVGTSVIATADQTFTNNPGGWALSAGASIAGNKLTCVNGYATYYNAAKIGKRYRVVYTVSDYVSGNIGVSLGSTSALETKTANGTYTYEGSVPADSNGHFSVGAVNGSGSGSVTSVTVIPIGALLATDATQPGAGTTLRDVSGNSAHITLGTGCGWALPSSNYFGSDLTIFGNQTASGSLSLTGATSSITLGTSTEIGSMAVTAAGNLTITPKTGQSTTITGNGIVSGNLTVSGTGTHTFGTTNTVTMAAGVLTATGNVTGSNLTTGGIVTATGNVSGGNLTTAGLISATGNITGGNLSTGGLASVTGNVSAGNFTTLGLVSAGTTITATGNVSGGNVTTGGIVSATGNVSGGNLTTGGVVTATGNVSGGNLTTGGLISATGNITGGNLITGGIVNATGTITGANIVTGGNVTATGVLVAGSGPTTITDSAGKVLAASLNTVGIQQGGTGLTTLTANAVITGNGTGSPIFIAPGTSGNVLTSNGTAWTSTAQHSSTYAEIYVADGSAGQSIATGSTYTKLTAFTSDGLSSNCTAASASDKITITVAGTYRLTWQGSWSSDTNNVTWDIAPFLGGVEQTKAEIKRKMGTASDVSGAGGTCLLDCSSVPVDVDLRAKHNAVGSVVITPSHINLNVNKIN